MAKENLVLLTTSPKSFCYPFFLNREQNKYIWLKISFLIFAENGRKSFKVFDDWLRTGKNYLG